MTLFKEDYYDKLDATDWAIVCQLQQDARMSFAELGRRVGMSSPAVQERVRKLEDYGIIEGYRAVINLPKAGFPITAFIRVGNLPNVDENRVEVLARQLSEVLECHHITGQDCYMVKIAATSIPHLEQLIGRFAEFTHTVTCIVLSSPVQNRIIIPSDEPS
jgi:Lrp/AsnC family leucine-responsive transcriptional regulator